MQCQRTFSSYLHIGIIHQGRLLFQGTLAELQQKHRAQLVVGVNQPERAIDCLNAATWKVERGNDGLLHISADTAADAAKVNELLVTAGCEVFHLASAPVSLEDIFLKLTREQVDRREA